MKKYFGLLGLCFLLCACGSKKLTIFGTKNLSDRQVVKHYEQSTPNFKTLRARIAADYSDEESAYNISISMRMEKDSAIWLSAKIAGFIPIAKVLITPEKIKYYEKIHNTYFIGDFRLISDWLGFKLGFEQLQNLLVGRALYDLNRKTYSIEKVNSGYLFKSEQAIFLKKLILLNPKIFTAKKQQLINMRTGRTMKVEYHDYEEMNDFYFPTTIIITSKQQQNSINIGIKYRSLDFGVPVSFPFEIPSGYEKIKL